MKKDDELIEILQKQVLNYTVKDLEICFVYESQDEIGRVEIFNKVENKNVKVFIGDQINIEFISKIFPQFFNKKVSFKEIIEKNQSDWQSCNFKNWKTTEIIYCKLGWCIDVMEDFDEHIDILLNIEKFIEDLQKLEKPFIK
jgi:hypothetical protein